MAGSPAAGDVEILQSIFVHRVLESGQIARLTGRSSPVIRRRLGGYLSQAGLIRVLHGNAADQKAYALSPQGMEQVAAFLGLNPKQLPFSVKPPSGPGSPFYRHMRLSNHIAIGFTLACREPGCPVALDACHFEWEMTDQLKARRSKKPWEKFLICEALPELADSQEKQILRPDLVLQLRHRPKNYAVAVYVEADRATMSVRGALHRKLRPYWLLFLRQGFSRYSAVAMRIVFVFSQIKTPQRLNSFWQTLQRFCQEQRHEHEQFQAARQRLARSQGLALAPLPSIDDFAACFRLGRWDELRRSNLLRDPLWHTHRGEQLPFVRGSAPPQIPKDPAHDPAPQMPSTLSFNPLSYG